MSALSHSVVRVDRENSLTSLTLQVIEIIVSFTLLFALLTNTKINILFERDH